MNSLSANTPTERRATVARPPTTRAAISNRTHLLPGIDGRSAAARRFRDLVADLAADLGGEASLSNADLALVRQCAGSVMASEQLSASIVNGQAVDADSLVRLGNTCARLLASLRRKGRQTPQAPSLAEYLATRQQPPPGAPPPAPALSPSQSAKRISGLPPPPAEASEDGGRD